MNRFTSQGQTRCQVCSSFESKGEQKVRSWLEANGIVFETQKRFIDCGGNRPYPFDFYLPKQNICIEYDGSQHYEQSRLLGDLSLIQARDAVKTKYCEAKGIQLIRIPYTEFDNIPDLLSKLIPR